MKLNFLKKLVFIPLLVSVLAFTNNNMEGNNMANAELNEDVSNIDYEIFPNPQEITYTRTIASLTKHVNVYMESSIDVYTKNKLYDILSLKDVKAKNVSKIVDNGNFNINLGVYKSGEDVDKLLKSTDLSYIENKIDAYYLEINTESITIIGKDTDAVFYGLASLKMIFEQSKKYIGTLIIKDYSNSKWRGFIEGYYGIPWTSDERIELMRFGEIVKSNIYIYAPKDDSYHSSNWRGLYSERDLKVLKEQIQAGLETKTKFAWAIHPFMPGSKPITDTNFAEGVQAIKDKFDQVYNAGVRQFVVSADDISVPEDGSTLTGYLHRDILNELVKWNKAKADCGDLIFVPTAYYYNDHNTHLTNYLRTLVENLDPSVSIMWTGERVCSSVKTGRFQEFIEVTGREPFMWLNWPVNDYSTSHVLMGKGEVLNDNYLDREIDFSGIVTNPMAEAEPSKLSIFAICDYTWNIHNFDMDKSYVASFKYVEKDTPNSLYEICQHLANAGKYEDKYFEEGKELATLIYNYDNAIENGGNVERRIEQLNTYFTKLVNSCEDFLNNGYNKKLIKALRGWVEMIRDMAAASKTYLTIEKTFNTCSDAELKSLLDEADTLYDRSFTHTSPVLVRNNVEQQIVDGGIVVLKPFLMRMRAGIRDEALLKLGLPTGVVYGGFPNGVYQGELSNIIDGDDNTFCWFNGRPEVDAFIRIDLEEVQEVRDIRILSGNGDGKDFMKGFVDYSIDAKSWTEIGTFNGEETYVDLRTKPIQARFIRLRNNNTANWVSFKEVSINTLSMDALNAVEYDGFTNGIQQGLVDYMFDGDENTFCWFGRTVKDAYIRMDLGETQEVTSIEMLMGNATGGDIMEGTIEYSLDGEAYTSIGSMNGNARVVVDLRTKPIQARYIRFRNSGGKVSWVAIREITLNSLDTAITNMFEFSGFSSGIQQGSLDDMVDGDENTFCWFGRTAQDDYIRMDLGEKQEITSIIILMGNATGGDIMEGTIEYSLDDLNYTPIASMTGDHKPIVDLRDAPIQARYIRLRNSGGKISWVAIREIYINTIDEDTPMVTSSGLKFVNDKTHNSSVSHINDGDLNTYAWYDWRGEVGSYVQIDLRKITQINNIVFYQSCEAIPADYFRDFTLQYSIDGESWITVGDDHYLATNDTNLEINLDLSNEPVNARYVRVVTNVYMSNGVTIREFNVNINL